MAESVYLSKAQALLFAYGEPLSAQAIAEAIGLPLEQVRSLMEQWANQLRADSQQGLCLLCHADTYQLVTKPEYSELIESFMKKDFSQSLSPAALETLTIILYRGPLSRSEIDYIRGVNSGFMVRSLLLRGLVDRLPGTKAKRFFVYQASCELLRFFGLQAVTDLPDYAFLHEKYETVLANLPKEEIINPETDVQDS